LKKVPFVLHLPKFCTEITSTRTGSGASTSIKDYTLKAYNLKGATFRASGGRQSSLHQNLTRSVLWG